VYQLYTDGGCKSRGLGSWAFAIINGEKLLESNSGLVDETTNNRMELQAIINGLKRFNTQTCEVEVLSDSAYCVNCFRQSWYSKWKKNNWKNASGEDVKNKDMWVELIDLVESFHFSIKWTHVKGHSGNKWNEYVDGLCNKEFNNSGIGGIVNV
jgi:ribonuclease HI